MLNAPGTRLQLEYHKLLSTFALNFNLRRYIQEDGDPQKLQLVDNFEFAFGLLYLDSRPDWVNWCMVRRCRLNR